MTQTNTTTEIEYCETCGTMLVLGECRRCNTETKATKVNKITKKVAVSKAEIHTIGIDYVVGKLIDQGISTTPSNETGIDLILNNGKTILVRAMSDELRMAVGVSDLNDLKSDYIIIVSNLNFSSIRNIYTLTINNIFNIAINKPRRATGIADYFINRSKYALYKNNYSILE